MRPLIGAGLVPDMNFMSGDSTVGLLQVVKPRLATRGSASPTPAPVAAPRLDPSSLRRSIVRLSNDAYGSKVEPIAEVRKSNECLNSPAAATVMYKYMIFRSMMSLQQPMVRYSKGSFRVSK